MSVTDILVDFAIASFFIAVGQLLRAKVPLVQKFFIPPSMIAGFIALALLLLCGIVIVVATLMFFGPAMNRGSWFERAIFVIGYSTGVFAIGFILLRIVDPENRSKTLNDTAFAAPFTTPAEMFAWSMGPMMLLNGSHWKFIGIYLVIMAACIIANIVFKWWWLKLPLDRPGVEEIG